MKTILPDESGRSVVRTDHSRMCIVGMAVSPAGSIGLRTHASTSVRYRTVRFTVPLKRRSTGGCWAVAAEAARPSASRTAGRRVTPSGEQRLVHVHLDGDFALRALDVALHLHRHA